MTLPWTTLLPGEYLTDDGRISSGRPISVANAAAIAASSGIVSALAIAGYGTTASGLTASGLTQGTATLLPAEFNVLTTSTATLSGAVLQSDPNPLSVVVNASTSGVVVFPPVNGTLGALSANAGLSVASGTVKNFLQAAPSSTQWYYW
jgi:hypothetical protein